MPWDGGGPVSSAPMTDGPSAPRDVFEEHRPVLIGVAYRILGSRTDADDVVQEAWLRWQSVDQSVVLEPRRYLFRVVANGALDSVRRSRARREHYVGQWLPEPMALEAGTSVTTDPDESLSLGMLLILQTLSPVERAVFVLHEAFGFPYDEIAEMIGRTEHAVRQLGYRARRQVQDGRPRFAVSRETHADVVRRFMDAATGGDLPALLDLLAPSVTLWADANGLSEMPREPLVGATAVAQYLVSVADFWPADRRLMPSLINGAPGVLVTTTTGPFMGLTCDVEASGRIVAVYAVRNPDKLGWLPGTTAHHVR
jgi:RNA polymerase sigma-70 factor (ECF subfamily)